MGRLILCLLTCVHALGSFAGGAAAHRPTDQPHQLHQMGDLTLESGQVIKDFAIINPGSIAGHFAAGGFIPADVEQINAEVGTFLDISTQRGAKLR